MFSWDKAQRPIVALAPMAGVTDAAYRQIIKKLAKDVVLYSEFLSTDAIHFGAEKTMRMMHFDPDKERPFIVQIFGKDPLHFPSAAKVIEEMGADGIDINMGCPAARVVSSCHGSALMKNPDLAAELVASAKKAVKISVSVKTRLGWDSPNELISFCTKLVEAGADALAVHGRTYSQGFSGAADWGPIYALKNQVGVPVIGNGDIRDALDAVSRIGNLDGVMIGRGTVGNPWVMGDIVEAFACLKVARCSFNATASSQQQATRKRILVPTIDRITFEDKIPLILEHCELAVKLKGERRGMLEMRKHLAGYVKGVDGAKELRSRLVRAERISDVKNILSF